VAVAVVRFKKTVLLVVLAVAVQPLPEALRQLKLVALVIHLLQLHLKATPAAMVAAY
jgi:hypothetical protein